MRTFAKLIALLPFLLLGFPLNLPASIFDTNPEIVIPQSAFGSLAGFKGVIVPTGQQFSFPQEMNINAFKSDGMGGGIMEVQTLPIDFDETDEYNVCHAAGCDGGSLNDPMPPCGLQLCKSCIISWLGCCGVPCFSCPDPSYSTMTFENNFQISCYKVCARSIGLLPCDGYCQMPFGGNSFSQSEPFCFVSVPRWIYELVEKAFEKHDDPSKTDEPVDIVTGNMFTFPQRDLVLSGVNETFEFYRTYNSRSEYDGPFGYGWTHSYNVVITKRSSTLYEVMDGDGKFHYFRDNYDWPSGFYTPVNNDGSKLESIYQQAHIWVRDDGTKFYFPWLISSPMDVPYRPTSIVYKDGNQLTFSPSDGSLPTQITDTHGRTIILAYDSGRITDIYLEPNKLIEYEYDTSGNLTTVSYPIFKGATPYQKNYVYQIPADHNLTEIRDERENSFFYSYDSSDRCITVEGEDDGNGPYFKTILQYPDVNHTTVERIRGAQTFTDNYTYSDMGYVVQVDHVDSGVTEKYSYDIVPDGITTVEKIIEKPSEGYYLKRVIHLDKYSNILDRVEGRVVDEEADPSGYPVRIFYEDTANPNFPTKVTDQRASSVNFVYNAIGKIAEIYQNNEGAPEIFYEVTDFLYNPNGTLDTITDPNGKIAGFSYYGNKELQAIDPPGVLPAVTYEYDGAGRITKITQKDDAGNDRVTDIVRDWLGRITQITYPEEKGKLLVLACDYDASDVYDLNASYGVNLIDTNGVKTQFLYNNLGLLWKVVNDRGEGKSNAVTALEYDAYGNIISLTDPEGNTTTFAYDSLDRLISVTYPAVDQYVRKKEFTYYPDGSLKTRTDQNGQTTTYTYDTNNRLSQITYPDLSTVTYTYEPNGLLASATNSAGAVTFQYDDINRLQNTNGTLPGNADYVEYQYHDGGQREYMTNLMGQTQYTLNDWNAIDDIVNPHSRTMTYSYNQYTGNLARIAATSSIYTLYDFDNLDRLDYYQLSNGSLFDYEYNDANLIDRISLPGAKSYEYVYDDMYRLTNEYSIDNGSPVYTNNYGYDLADNRTSLANGSLDTYEINALNQVTAIYRLGNPIAQFAYDLNGNLTSRTTGAGTVTMEYDYENRLVRITYPSNSGTTEFVYDALGRRLKTIEKDGLGQITGETHYAYDGLDLIAELDANDALIAGFTHGPGIDDPLIARYDGTDYLYQKNHQGSVLGLATFGGVMVKSYRYDAFGNVKQETGPTINRGFTYTSRERHARSGLYYYRARWYSPEIGRFITQDPIGYLGGANLYAYVGNDPLSYVDPFGLCKEEAGWLDWLQGLLDVAGALEPTPICDLTNTAVYAGRGEYDDALLTLAGVIPYIGDAGKGAKYASKIGKVEWHHLIPRYLGGPANGLKVRVDAVYHQLITNEFRRAWAYGQGMPAAEQVQEIVMKVYKKYPVDDIIRKQLGFQ
ncbi:MAG: hypothetical protein C4520_03080 [Candidatus Abyssobacteria bacterium SURF_5]|uniref:RHS repeat protein n=1 Tax=Abyssobacteria bacterium (strain SURF_5) TaxID=2093360 RepID=A0A3A4P2D6_ABYX5|nr:MAG: hypothetical protein C4520_03080 [Candidatus Abyssubacteria bacterium SURF_5]